MEITPAPAKRGRGRPPECKCPEPQPNPHGPTCMRCGLKLKVPKEVAVPEPIAVATPAPVTEEPGPLESIVEPPIEAIVEELSKPQTWSPPPEVFLNLRGKLYLPARRRVQWMRGEPEPHPDWTIDTEIIEHERGKFIRAGKVDGGYALVRANIFDATGRLIATGTKSEYSENFPDYLEKAETGAIARAAAVAGYGTEAALDFDEGAADGRVADSPVDVGGSSEARPISITAATAAPVGRGGSPTTVTKTQIRKLSALSSSLGLGTRGMVGVANDILEASLDEEMTAPDLVDWLDRQSAADIGKLIHALEVARDATK